MKSKTKSSAKKRFKMTGSGKIRVSKSCKNHRLISKSKRQKKLGRSGIATIPGNEKNIRVMLPYSK